MAMNEFNLLFSPKNLGKVTIKNRAVFSAHLTNLSEHHLVGDRLKAYYIARAKGGTGLIITEELGVHPSDWAYEKLIDVYLPEVIAGFKSLTDEVHRYDCKIFAQLNHNGSQASSVYSKRPTWSASPVMDPLFRECCHGIDKGQIDELLEYYKISAKNVIAGGFDGIELQGSHSSILRQFLSPLSNHREDEYNGSLENRFRLIKEVGEAIRSEVGYDIALGIRLSGEEFVEGGLTLNDTVEIAKLINNSGLFDYINTSVSIATYNLFLVEGSMNLPPAYAIYMANEIKKNVNIPVIGVGRIKAPKQAEKVLQEGKCDFVGMVRGQISDPELMNKAAAGDDELINVCLSCNQDCIGRVGMNRTIGCVQNPEVGFEKNTLKPAEKTKTVAIIGAGPAGLQAALTTAKRGHKVTIFEKNPTLGGNIPLASSLPKRGELVDVIRNLTVRLAKKNVEIKLNTEVKAEEILKANFDVAIIATGALPQWHYLLGENVYDLTEWLITKKDLGKKVVIFDCTGNYASAGTAELLGNMGVDVSVVSSALRVGQGLGRTTDLELWTRRVEKLGVKLISSSNIMSITDGTVSYMDNYSGATYQIENVDSVLIGNAMSANNALYYELKDKIESYLIGDAAAPRLLGNCIFEGYEVAKNI